MGFDWDGNEQEAQGVELPVPAWAVEVPAEYWQAQEVEETGVSADMTAAAPWSCMRCGKTIEAYQRYTVLFADRRRGAVMVRTPIRYHLKCYQSFRRAAFRAVPALRDGE